MDRPFEVTPSIPRQSYKLRDSKEGGFLNAIRNMNGWVRAAVAALGLLTAESGCAHLSPQQKSANACRVIGDVAEDNKITLHVTRNSGGYNNYSYQSKEERAILFWRWGIITEHTPSSFTTSLKSWSEACEKNKREGLPLLTEALSRCQDISEKVHALELLGTIAETCDDFEGAEQYYNEGVRLAAQDPSQKTIPFRNQIQRSLIRIASKKTKPACDEIKEADGTNMYGQFGSGRFKKLRENVEKCNDDFLKLEACANLGEGNEESDPFAAEQYYREALKIADGLVEKLGGFNFPTYASDYVSWQYKDPVYADNVFPTRKSDAERYRKYREKSESGLRKLAALSDEEKRRIAQKYAESRIEGITFFRAGEDPTRPGAAVEEITKAAIKGAIAATPHVSEATIDIAVAVEKITRDSGNQTSAPSSLPSSGEIEVETGATGYLSIPCTDTGSATRIGERQDKTCTTFSGPACVIPNLSPGKYLVKAERSGGCEKRKAGPVEVEVKPGERIKVDFSRKFAR